MHLGIVCFGQCNANLCGFWLNFGRQRCVHVILHHRVQQRPDSPTGQGFPPSNSSWCFTAAIVLNFLTAIIIRQLAKCSIMQHQLRFHFPIFYFPVSAQPLQNFWLHSGKLLIAISALYFFQHLPMLLLGKVWAGSLMGARESGCEKKWASKGSSRWARN